MNSSFPDAGYAKTRRSDATAHDRTSAPSAYLDAVAVNSGAPYQGPWWRLQRATASGEATGVRSLHARTTACHEPAESAVATAAQDFARLRGQCHSLPPGFTENVANDRIAFLVDCTNFVVHVNLFDLKKKKNMCQCATFLPVLMWND